MRKLINNFFTIALEGLIAILCALIIICVILACVLVLMTIFMAIFGEHDTWWIRIIGIIILCFFVGKLMRV
jgi:hypothetical protein